MSIFFGYVLFLVAFFALSTGLYIGLKTIKLI
nr:cytochrome b6-f complex subunit VI [Chroothece richteriana]YP_010336254.1 cytochrome b6-f complex subunit VI [Chroodactylon ornatum]UNJ14269.1 cytochrome b6-f complex subunit VI [Chroothece richteriana]UNJ14660.1 cytochrome b6-f complex subunit VI [Chroodactylon ornatum]